MAYTQSDLDSVKAAILALATGERVARVTLGDKTIQYSDAQISELRALRAEIQAELGTAAARRRYVVISSDKGL